MQVHGGSKKDKFAVASIEVGAQAPFVDSLEMQVNAQQCGDDHNLYWIFIHYVKMVANNQVKSWSLEKGSKPAST